MKNPCLTLRTALFIISIGLLFACNKSQDTTANNTHDAGLPAEQTVTAGITGRVLDEKGVPVQGATVNSGTASTTTDVNGVFSFSNISMSSRFGYVKVTKSGYFTGSRSIITNAGAANYVNIQLTPRTSSGSYPAATGGTINVQTGDTVTFPAGAVVNAATHAAYTGNVHVYAAYLDPTSPDIFKRMPGDLRGIGSDGKETAIQSFGMMMVELEGDGGEKLQLAPGKMATLSLTIPDSLQKTAPATIPLWYFNDSTGRWIQEGAAVRAGNSYVGQVSHFSIWNCDIVIQAYGFKVRVKDQYGNPVPYTYIAFRTSATTAGYIGYTDSSGYVRGLVGKGMTGQMQVLTECGYLLAGANVGPVLADVDMGTIIVTLQQTDLTLTGTVLDCSNNPVANGFVNVYLDGLTSRAQVTAGKFRLPIHRCYPSPATAQITAGDYGTSQQGSTQSLKIPVVANGGDLDAGQLSACGITYDQFISLTFNGSTRTLTVPPGSFNYNNGNVQAYMGSNWMGFNLSNLTGAGDYTPTYFYYYFYPDNIRLGPASDHTLKCTVTGFGPVNQFVTGTWSGNVVDSTSNTVYPLTGSFKILRTN